MLITKILITKIVFLFTQITYLFISVGEKRTFLRVHNVKNVNKIGYYFAFW